MAEGRLPASRFLKPNSRRRSRGSVLVMDRTRLNTPKPLDEGIKAAVLAQSQDLSRILQGVDEIRVVNGH